MATFVKKPIEVQATPVVRRALTSVEYAKVEARILEPGRTPSPAAKQAIAEFKRMKVRRVK